MVPAFLYPFRCLFIKRSSLQDKHIVTVPMVSVIDGVECIDIGPLKLNVFFLSLAGKTVSKAVVDHLQWRRF